MKVVAIHQLNFFPWLGYFNKIARCDAFVFLDDAQFSKTGGTWSNRVKIWKSGQSGWLSIPVKRNISGVQYLNEVRIMISDVWIRKQLKTLEQTYSKAKFFSQEWDFIQSLFQFNTDFLSQYNIVVIKKILDHLGIRKEELYMSSEMNITSTGTERLIEITKRCHGTTYLCGGGASGYQEDEMFETAGVNLCYQNFVALEYRQFSTEFTPGLSVIDALFHCGATETKRLICKGSDAC